MEYKQGDFLEWYEEFVYNLQNPIQLPANGQHKTKVHTSFM